MISLAEWLALGIFCLSVLRSVIELVVISRWFDARKSEVSGTELNKLVAEKRQYEAITAQAFTLGLALITGLSLALSFSTSEVQVSDMTEIQEELDRIRAQLDRLEAAGLQDENE